MGLDINAYRQVKLLGVASISEEYENKYDWRNTVYVYPDYVNDPDFPDHVEGLEAGGVYEYAEAMDFRAGSYSGYGQWRDTLSIFMLSVSTHQVWDSPEKFKDMPFYFLIDFSDCEGIISGTAARKLAKDFAAHRARADTYPETWWRELYARWQQAFEMAADGGFVSFR